MNATNFLRDVNSTSPGQPALPPQVDAPASNVVEPKLIVEPSPADIGFFGRNRDLKPEAIQGVIREGQIGVFGGPFGKGKTPALQDIAVHASCGKPWCGRAIGKRPVIYIDHETSGPVWRRNVENVAARLGVPLPRVPGDIDVYLEQDSYEEPGTKLLHAALKSPEMGPRLQLIENALKKHPNAAIIIDPLELLFRIDTNKKNHVLYVYIELRKLFSQFPHALCFTTFNLRKHDKKLESRPDLLKNPRAWLEEVCGTLDIMNRSDVRLGMDDSVDDEDVRVINGIRRGEEMHPLIVRSVDVNGLPATDGPDLAGFEQVPVSSIKRTSVFTPQQFRYWTSLPQTFRFEEQVENRGAKVPRSSLSRLLQRAQSVGLVRQNRGDVWEKCDDTCITETGRNGDGQLPVITKS